ncbi:metallophosphoesterase [Geoalkalibacter sp.]|uniref:metallophosphoesterase n=1 Tax=Geoalkalibacter sp. TaxID=3041440 RepID=UPI00272EC2FC|nr:metallophosphoesterase [Geoalkalibacter sp.]
METSENFNPTSAKTLSRRTFLAVTGLGAGGLGAGLGRGFWHEPQAVRVEHLRLPLAKMTGGARVRFVQLSDLHIQSFESYHRKVADLVNNLAADLILITGDFLDRERNLAAVRQFVELLRAPRGIFAVQGNWEYWARIEGENLRQAFARWGVTLLINERVDLSLGATPLSLLGLDYPSAADALKKLQAQADPARVNLLLSHVPAFAHDLLDGRIDLLLCGHTHGGQVRLPLITPFYLPRFSEPFVAGLYRVGPDTPLYVNRGIGTSLLPVRFLCPPEITLFELQAMS